MQSIRLLFVLATLALSGCAVGNSVDFKSQATTTTMQTDKAVALAVQDQRSFILNGDKQPNFVGIRRGGFGNPFDVTTRSGASFASEVAGQVAQALTTAGAKVETVSVGPNADPQKAVDAVLGTKAERGVALLIKQWKSDLYANMEVDFDLRLQVYDAEGKLLAEAKQAGNNRLGSVTFESELSKAASQSLKSKLEALLNDPAVMAALE